MAYSYDFKDNVVYGAKDINAIRASMLTKGVIEETATSCKAEINEGKVKISQGQAIFSDGCRLMIDEEGIELDYIQGSVNYIFLFNNLISGVCEILVSQSVPEGDYVLIAEIDIDGNLIDRREFTNLKTADVERFAESFYAEFEFTDDMAENEVIGVITLPKSNCSLIKLYMNCGSSFYGQVNILPKENIIIWHYEGNASFSMGDEQEFYGNNKTRKFKYEVSGNQLTIKFISTSTKDSKVYKLKYAGICQR